MIRVILTTPAGREIKLIPEHTPVREVLEQFNASCEGTAFIANGSLLQEDDLDGALLKVAKEDEVQFTALQESSAETADVPKGPSLLKGAEAEAYIALARAKDMLDLAMRKIAAHGEPVDEDEPPF